MAAQQHSSTLAQLASRITAIVKYGATAGDDVFTKVRGLISDLITKLENEASSEATEKAYCDEQMTKTEAKRDELNGDIGKLTAKIDKAAAHSAQLKDEVKALQAGLAALAKQQAEMDTVRHDSHAAYVQAKADLELGLGGVNKALALLREYYGGAALLQAEQPAMPEQHEKATGAGNSIVGILEVVESDFAKNLASEETQEADASAAYDKTTQANKITRAVKEQDVKYKTENFKALDKDIAELSGDRRSADTELSAVLEYYAKIKQRCIAKPETYENRSARRAAEIKGLKEALAILEEETAFVQGRKRGHHGFFLAAH